MNLMLGLYIVTVMLLVLGFLLISLSSKKENKKENTENTENTDYKEPPSEDFKYTMPPLYKVEEELQDNNICIEFIQSSDGVTKIFTNDDYLVSVEVREIAFYDKTTYKYKFNNFVFYTSNLLYDSKCKKLNQNFNVIQEYLDLKNDAVIHSKRYVNNPNGLPEDNEYNEYRFKTGRFKNYCINSTLYMQVGNRGFDIEGDTTLDEHLEAEKELHKYVEFEYIDLSDWIQDTKEINGYALRMIDNIVFASKTSEFRFYVDFFRNELTIYRDKVKLIEVEIESYTDTIKYIKIYLQRGYGG